MPGLETHVQTKIKEQSDQGLFVCFLRDITGPLSHSMGQGAINSRMSLHVVLLFIPINFYIFIFSMTCNMYLLYPPQTLFVVGILFLYRPPPPPPPHAQKK